MATVLYDSPIFGPIHSRRLGISLGINLLPAARKVCSFDCIYCECGFNRSGTPVTLPTREEVRTALERQLKTMQATNVSPNVLTFAGNGEPTMHPQFAEIIDDTLTLRDAYFPSAKVSVLSNAVHIGSERVFEALKRVDNNILKLDTINPAYIRLVNRPRGQYDVPQLIQRMKAFDGRCIVQTMFMTGTFNGTDTDNTTDAFVLPWVQAVNEIAPRQVMIYTIDRETPADTLRKASPESLNRIAELLRQNGHDVSVAY
ncbi:MAG: radical SAM protein [Prevotellaceae bacterium]|jgi:wyosine [tRNA(Phe)-imidazoG37] synthetase (radical SAM superfamily)|nr:radical SAM protein [Prevotellaceae bacterium]